MADPTKIATFDKEGSLRVVVETPRGSRNKYSYDPEEQIFVLKKVLPAGMSFPYDFGFIPGTKAEDGDPVDVLVLMDEPAFPGCVLTARLIGAIEAEEVEGGKKQRNDRLIAVSNTSHSYANVKNVQGLGERLLKDLEKFFKTYQELEGKEFHLLGWVEETTAMELVKRGRK